MTAITIAATITVLSAVLVPALCELQRVREERDNPVRKLRVRTRRSQAMLASTSLIGFR